MRYIILVVIVLIAAVAGVAALKLTDANQVPPQAAPIAIQQGAPEPQLQTVDVLVARAPIEVGAVVDDTMVDKQPWPKHLVLEGFVVAGSPEANVNGMVARSTFQAREPFIISKLANPNDANFLAASLPKGMRAITIPVDIITGVAGYVFPGDRVDVIVTHQLPSPIEDIPGGSRPQADFATEVLTPNIRVLAVNARTVVDTSREGQKGPQQAPGPVNPTSVSLEVTREDAQRIRLAEKTGSLSLVLRPISETVEAGIPMPALVGDLSALQVVGEQRNQGIDVVRFSRSGVQSVPGTQVQRSSVRYVPKNGSVTAQ